MGINQRVIKVSKIHWEGHNKLQMPGQHSYMNIFFISQCHQIKIEHNLKKRALSKNKLVIH